MTAENQYGHSVNPHTVKLDMQEHLKNWITGYLQQGERESIPPRTPNSLLVKTWSMKTRLDNLPEIVVPAIIIASPGTAGKPYKKGKIWCAKWIVRVTALCSAPDEDVTQELADIYCHAIKMAVLQNKMINKNPDVEGVDWTGDGYNLVGATQTRTLGASQVVFEVEYKNVVDESQGPINPVAEQEAAPDPGPWPTVKEGGVHTSIERKKINGPI